MKKVPRVKKRDKKYIHKQNTKKQGNLNNKNNLIKTGQSYN
jgi:hypothetical protein